MSVFSAMDAQEVVNIMNSGFSEDSQENDEENNDTMGQNINQNSLM